jgi:CubicO group peptidase (beta-lactamase class C family)
MSIAEIDRRMDNRYIRGDSCEISPGGCVALCQDTMLSVNHTRKVCLMMKYRARYISASLLFTLLALVAACSPAGSRAQSKNDKIDELLNEYFQNGVLNGTVLVAERGNILYEKGFGYADMEWKVPNENLTKYNLASCTKQFVAMLVLRQVEKGTMRLDAKISDYLPRYPKENGRRITIHQLLNHSSGIPNYTESAEFGPVYSRTTYASPDSFVTVFADSALEFEPGSKFTYNNSAYFLLGVILEKVTGKPFSTLLQEEILDPLHMANSGMDDQYSLVAKRAAGYNRGMLANTHAGYWDRTSLYTAGGMYSTVEDLLRWDQALYTDELLPEKYRELLFRQSVEIDSSTGYGYGWFLKRVALNGSRDSLSVVYHTGTITGFNALIYRIPATRRTFICLNNLLVGRDHLIAMAKGCMNILYDVPYSRPKHSLAARFGAAIIDSGISRALDIYKRMNAERDRYNLSEDEMNTLGYELLQRRRTADALAVFKLNAAAFPASANVYDSLGDAYERSGENTKAIESYRKSLELDPKNTAGAEKLKKLQSK